MIILWLFNKNVDCYKNVLLNKKDKGNSIFLYLCRFVAWSYVLCGGSSREV